VVAKLRWILHVLARLTAEAEANIIVCEHRKFTKGLIDATKDHYQPKIDRYLCHWLSTLELSVGVDCKSESFAGWHSTALSIYLWSLVTIDFVDCNCSQAKRVIPTL